MAEAELPSILISPVLESPPVPFTVSVSADVMPALPTEMPLPLVLLLVRFPPIVRLEPPPPPVLFPSSSIVPLPVMLTLPVGATAAPFCSQKFPATPVKPVSALLLPSVPASATRAFAPLSCSVPSIVVIWPLLNSRSASPCRIDLPGLRPRRAEPRRRVGDVQGRLDGRAAFDVDLRRCWRARRSRSPSKCRPNVMPPLPIEMALPLVLLLVRSPPIVRLRAPAAAGRCCRRARSCRCR